MPSSAPLLFVSTFVSRSSSFSTRTPSLSPRSPAFYTVAPRTMPCTLSDQRGHQHLPDYGGTTTSASTHPPPPPPSPPPPPPPPHPSRSQQPSSPSSPPHTHPHAASSPPSPPPPPPPPPPLSSRLVVPFFILILFLAGSSVATATGLFRPDTLLQIAQWFESLGPNGVYLYGLLYFLLELVAVPAIPLTLGSGYLFGLVKGTITVSVASTLAASAAFLIARYGLRESVSNLAERYPRFQALDRAIGKEGFRFVFLLRLSPLLPFSISNYLYGLTSVNLLEYVLGSWLGMLPGTIAYVSTGSAVNALTDLSGKQSSVSPVLLIIGVVATITVLGSIGKMAASVIESAEEDGPQHTAE